MIETFEKIARKEIEKQSFELTKQYLSVHKLVYENGKPKIADVIMNDGEQSAEVYFSIADEAYYFVVYLDTSPEVTVRFMGMSAGNRVYLSVSANVANLEKLLKGINLVPSKTWQKGTQISYRNTNRFHEDSGFTFQLEDKKTGEVEEKLANLINKLETSNLIQIIESEEIHKVVRVVYYGYKEQMWGINLKPKIIEKLSKLNASLDIDLYASGPDLE
ncbi:hypothetical protein BBD42_16205 [Paenibacillus sp. BIHB 4019]|uniref:DUF4279 domain-containing protein n=1 Tax=Paenibacillus sp. BIHB 4019 TaxID=1870819 RepID=A0A1B2DJE2_9BACL|nr:DUF4279 domain-containing protein [Paenibacillus sp. BIHB 4019]ANY67842.1 hypothetical protein BBD42_16205 [Paenibacillus sp. BIHB 4019]